MFSSSIEFFRSKRDFAYLVQWNFTQKKIKCVSSLHLLHITIATEYTAIRIWCVYRAGINGFQLVQFNSKMTYFPWSLHVCLSHWKCRRESRRKAEVSHTTSLGSRWFITNRFHGHKKKETQSWNYGLMYVLYSFNQFEYWIFVTTLLWWRY